MPSIMILDGLDFDKDNTEILDALEKINSEFSIFISYLIIAKAQSLACAPQFFYYSSSLHFFIISFLLSFSSFGFFPVSV